MALWSKLEQKAWGYTPELSKEETGVLQDTSCHLQLLFWAQGLSEP